MGHKIVLTATRTEMSDFNLNPFRAFMAGFPSRIFPTFILRKKLYPLPDNDGYIAKFAPYGLRKVEAYLCERFGEENVAVVYPTALAKAIDKNTKAIGVSTMDPLGLAYVSVTYSSLLGFGSKCLNALEFELLMNAINKYRNNARLIVGGQGSAQILEANLLDKWGIDCLVIGEAEGVVADLFEKAISGKDMERVVYAAAQRSTSPLPIKSPSLYGAVEITRGCGRGCKFCTPTMRRLQSLPLDMILKETRINAAHHTRMVMLVTEDLFLYRVCERFLPNRNAVLGLISKVSAVDGVEYLQVTHTSWPPAVYDRKMIEEVAETLIEKTCWKIGGKRYISDIIGIETGSVRLMEKYMKGKALPYDVSKWPEIVIEGAGIYADNDWYPGGTIITGWPEETATDTVKTLELVDELRGTKIVLIPLIFVPFHEAVLSNASRLSLKDMSEYQWELMMSCWSHNIREFAPEVRCKIMAVSMFLLPLYYLRHGSNFLKPALKFAYWDRVLDIKKFEKKYEEYKAWYHDMKSKADRYLARVFPHLYKG